jgi:hypothetical protein
MSHLLRWLREAGILICTISLLFLPWFYDTFPYYDLSPIVMGTEFLAVRSPVVIGAIICLWFAYLVSRFTSYKWQAAVPFFVGALLYHYVLGFLVGGRWDPPGIPLGRFGFNQDKNFELLIGGWLNIVGVFLLFIGLTHAESKRNGKIFILSGGGVILGWVLFWGSVVVFLNILSLPFDIPEIVVWANMVGFPIISGVLAFYLARKYTTHNEIPLST